MTATLRSLYDSVIAMNYSLEISASSTASEEKHCGVAQDDSSVIDKFDGQEFMKIRIILTARILQLTCANYGRVE